MTRISLWLALPLATLMMRVPVPVAPLVYDLAPSSRFEIWTGKAGLLGAFGHSHIIRAGTVTGTIVWDPDRIPDSRVEIVVPVADLHVVRRGADEKDWADVEKAMREEVLHPDLHPNVEFRSRIVTRNGDGVHVVGDLSLEGRSRPVGVGLGRLLTRVATMSRRAPAFRTAYTARTTWPSGIRASASKLSASPAWSRTPPRGPTEVKRQSSQGA